MGDNKPTTTMTLLPPLCVAVMLHLAAATGRRDTQIPKYDPNAVNKLTSSFLDPSSSKLGAGGASGGAYNPDQWNTLNFNLFDPKNQLGKRGLFRRQSQQPAASGATQSPSPS